MRTARALDSTLIIVHIDVEELSCCLTAAIDHSALASLGGLLKAISAAGREASGLKIKLRAPEVRVDALDLNGETMSQITNDADRCDLHDAPAVCITALGNLAGTRAVSEKTRRSSEKKKLLECEDLELANGTIVRRLD